MIDWLIWLFRDAREDQLALHAQISSLKQRLEELEVLRSEYYKRIAEAQAAAQTLAERKRVLDAKKAPTKTRTWGEFRDTIERETEEADAQS